MKPLLLSNNEIAALAQSIHPPGRPVPIDAMTLAAVLQKLSGKPLDLGTLAREVAQRRELPNPQSASMDLVEGSHSAFVADLEGMVNGWNAKGDIHAEMIRTKPDAGGNYTLSVLLAGAPSDVEAAKQQISQRALMDAKVQFQNV